MGDDEYWAEERHAEQQQAEHFAADVPAFVPTLSRTEVYCLCNQASVGGQMASNYVCEREEADSWQISGI